LVRDSVNWDEIAKLLVEPQDPKKPVIFDVQTVAKRQIESAILLWFLEADIGSIYALTVAAQELVDNAKAKDAKERIAKGLPKEEPGSDFPAAMKAFMRVRQRFLKHGPDRNLRASVDLSPRDVSAVLFSAVGNYTIFYHKTPPLMKLFAARFSLERPSLLPRGQTAGEFLMDRVSVDDLAGLSRSEFLLGALTRCGNALACLKGANPKAD